MQDMQCRCLLRLQRKNTQDMQHLHRTQVQVCQCLLCLQRKKNTQETRQ